MITEEQKYRSEIFKISGFATMSPFGRLFLQPIEIFTTYGTMASVCYIIISVGLFLIGLLLILKGYESVDILIRRE